VQDNSIASIMINETLEEKRISTTIHNETTSPRIKITEKNYEIKTQEQKGISY
jgi:hypothetical protein